MWWTRGVDVAELLLELYARIPPLARDAVDGLDLETLMTPPAPGVNTIAWLVWHAARVQDDHVADLLDATQVWIDDDWAPRFGLDPDPSNTGYGHSVHDIATVRPERADVLIEYQDAVDRRTRALLGRLTDEELDRVVDRRWDPPVTLGVRLVSIADDSLQHLGQAAYLRGLLTSRHT